MQETSSILVQGSSIFLKNWFKIRIIKISSLWKKKQTVIHIQYFKAFDAETHPALLLSALLFKSEFVNSASVYVCLIRVVHRVMLLSRCVQRTGPSWRPSTATSAAWKSVMWRCLRAPLRRWTSCWWGGRSTGAVSRRRHVSYDVSAAGLWGCFSQLCVRVGGASRLPVFPLSLIHSLIHSWWVSCPHFLPRQEWASGAVGIWLGEFFFLYSIQIWVCQMLFHSGGMEGFDLGWFSTIFLNLNVHKIFIHIIISPYALCCTWKGTFCLI